MGAQYLRAHTSEFAAQLDTWHRGGLVAPWDITPYTADATGLIPSPDDTRRYVGTPRMTGLSRALSAGASEFHAQTRITSTCFDNGLWFLQSENGRDFGPFDALVISVPPKQAEELIPADSPLMETAKQHFMLPSWTLLLSCDETLVPGVDAVYVKEGPLRWVARNSSKPGRAEEQSWVIQASAHWSDQHLETPRPEVQAELLDAFRSLTGADKLTLRNSWLHRWLYALPSADTSAPAELLLSEPQRSLYLCGDWCQGNSAEGAWLSGRECASRIIKQGNT